MRRALVSVALSAAALGMALFLCEAATRLLDGQPLTQLRLLPPVPQPTAPSRRLDPTVGGGPLADDIDPLWLDTAAPPLPERRPADPELLKRVRAAQGLDIQPFELTRIWNRTFAETRGCAPGNVLQRIPPVLLVFDPSEPIEHPVFRYPPSRTLPIGMVTNQFGWRGPDIPLDKSPRTIRLAFVGASTTVGLPNLPFSYPEYVVHWLNLWAQHTAVPVHFDGINAGREGVKSADIAAIIRQELLPLEPDLVLYYEGANQSLCARPTSAFPPRAPRGNAWIAISRLLAVMRDHSQLVRRLEKAVLRVEAGNGDEPAKPALAPWQVVRDETDSVNDIRHLRRRLRGFRDLDSARVALANSGGELALSSFAWLVFDGLRLDPALHGNIFRHLNEWCWPHRYADVRRDLDNQNHMLEQYTTSQQLPFIDVAGMFPSDPNLFFDSIHLNANGERIHAWIVFRALIPIVRARLALGIWPRADQVPQQEHPGIRPGYSFTLSCRAPR